MDLRAELNNIGHWLFRNIPFLASMIVWFVIVFTAIKLLTAIGEIDDSAIKLLCLMVWCVLMIQLPRLPRVVEDRFGNIDGMEH